MNYDKEKVKQFQECTIKDYSNSLIVENIANVRTVEKTDNTFTQVGIRPLVDEDMLIAPNFIPELPSAGRMIAMGERDFLIKTILSEEKTRPIKFKEDTEEFPKEVYDFDDAVILLSTKFYVEVFTKLMHRIDYEERYPRLDKRYKILPVPEKVLGNKIIIIGKDAIFWDKRVFDNEITGKKEKIDIIIKPASAGKVDITIRSLNKIRILNKEDIKILEIVEKV